MVNLPHSNINGKFILDGKEYDIETFKVKFSQPVDYKGQLQHEIKGGQLMVTITQNADNNLFLWAKTSTMRKCRQILFQTD
jgi:predicted metallo-beta-lactamase superfamily hydrolase